VLSKTVAAKIEDAIRQRKVLKGDKLPSELELCEQFSVSRTAIREALRIVSGKGLISIQKGKGIFVRGISADSVTTPLRSYLLYKNKHTSALDVIHARQIIEPPITAYAATHHTAEDEAILQHDIEILRAFEGDKEELARMDMAFHLHIANASHNNVMPLILDPIHRLMPDIKRAVYATNYNAKESAVVWHSKIVEEIIKGDPDSAFTAMKEHLRVAEEQIQHMLLAQEKLRNEAPANGQEPQ
jgi:GntR family transcriptional regulator, transcriptional repressor for pyruvate dehydrogenase complex